MDVVWMIDEFDIYGDGVGQGPDGGLPSNIAESTWWWTLLNNIYGPGGGDAAVCVHVYIFCKYLYK